MLKLTTTLIISLALSLVSTFSFAQVTADFTVDKQNVCDGATTVIYTDNSSINADDWTWTFPNGTPSSATGKGPHVVTYAPGTPLGAQSVTLVVQDKSKLPSVVSDIKTASLLNIIPRPNVTLTGVGQPIINCSGKTVGASLVSTVAGTTGNTSFSWTVATPPNDVLGIVSPGAGAGSRVDIGDVLENNSGKDATVVYTVTSTYLGCSGNTIDIPVKVRAKTEPLLLDKDNICPNDVVKLKTGLFPSGEAPLGTYRWDVDGVTQESNSDTLDMAVDKNVVVTVIYTDLCGDEHYSNAVVLNTKQEVILDFVKGDSCVNSVIPFTPINISDLSNTTIVDSWSWDFGNSVATSTSQNPITTTQFNKDGVYLVTLNAISEGCNVGEIINPVKIFNCAAGLQDDDVISSMFPNPTTDLVNISLTNTYNGNVNLLDCKGSTVFSAGFFGDKVTLSTIDLPNGIYMVLIDTTIGFKAKQLLMINK